MTAKDVVLQYTTPSGGCDVGLDHLPVIRVSKECGPGRTTKSVLKRLEVLKVASRSEAQGKDGKMQNTIPGRGDPSLFEK